MILLKKFFALQIQVFDQINHHWESDNVVKFISNLVLVFFLAGLLLGLGNHLNITSLGEANSPFFAIELAFNILLIFEILGLIFLIPNSVADSVGKQFEIISLLLLRDAFKEFGHYLEKPHWDMAFLLEMAPIVTDAFGAILIFLITVIFYKSQRHVKITRNQKEQQNYVRVKKLLSVYLAISFFGLGIYDLLSAYSTHEFIYSLRLFYNLLIFADIFILLFSLRYNSKYYNLFRYSSFALATIFLRLTLSAPAYFNVALALIAGLMVLIVTFIYNRLLDKPVEPYVATHTQEGNLHS